jgi:TolB-like protein
MSDNPTPEKPKSSDPNLSIPDAPSFWSELKRRKVMRVAITYGVVAWILIQVSATVFPQLGMPEWAPRMVTLLLLIGFPVALIIAWAFELTPDGIKTTQHAREDRGDEPVSKKEKRNRNWIAVGLAAGLPTLMFGVLTGVFYFKAKTAEETLAASQQAEFDRSIAVLPLTNMSPDEENAFFADGVHEDILTNLSKIEELLVIARTSTLRYRNTVKGLSEVGAELNVRYLVEGSVRRAANQVRVTVQLIDTQTEGHVWAENYDRSLDNIFAIQSEIAEAIADQLHAELSPEEVARIERLPTASQDAYDAYKQGSVDGGRLDKLYRATELDPTFAEAWAEIALLLYRDGDTDEEGLERAHRALEQARRYGQGLPHIPFAESFYYSHYLNT